MNDLKSINVKQQAIEIWKCTVGNLNKYWCFISGCCAQFCKLGSSPHQNIAMCVEHCRWRGCTSLLNFSCSIACCFPSTLYFYLTNTTSADSSCMNKSWITLHADGFFGMNGSNEVEYLLILIGFIRTSTTKAPWTRFSKNARRRSMNWENPFYV